MTKQIQCSLCDRTSSTHHISQHGLCTACEMAFRYWKNKTPKQIMARARQVDSFHNRFEIMLGNIKRIPAKTRKRA